MAQLLRDFVKIENDFTIIPNEIARNKEMKSSTKNILIAMLSLPPTWDFSIAGITTCVREGYDTVQKALVELEQIGYITRSREHKEDGTFGAMIYTIHQFPVSEDKNTYKKNHKNQDVKNPKQVKTNNGENQDRQKPVLGNSIQLITDKELNKDLESNTNFELSINEEKGENINKVNAKVQTSTSKKKMHTHKTAKQKYLAKKEDELEMLNNMLTICSSYSEQIGNEIFEALEHYLDRYTQKTGLIHPILKQETLEEIIDKMASHSDIEYEHYGNIAEQEGTFIKIIDAFFDEDFGNRTGIKTNWHLPHFMSDGVLNRLTQRLWEKGEVY